MKHKLESRLPRNINNLKYADDTTLMAESEEELKSILMKLKEESEKVGLKLNIQLTMVMTSAIISWQIDGETMEALRNFSFECSRNTKMVTATMKLKDTSSLEESYDQPRQHIKKRHYFVNKDPPSQSYGFFQ